MFNLIPWKRRKEINVPAQQIRDDFHSPLSRMRDEFDALWDRLAGSWERGGSLWDEGPWSGLASGLEDQPGEYVFRADLPGFEPEELDITISGNTLQVRAEHRKQSQGKNGGGYHYGSFQRIFTLPYGVEADKIDAQYRNGVLEIHLPKTAEAKGKKIAVKSG